MKTLELRSRKNTTSKALESVIEFINSFNFTDYTDLPYVESSHFNLKFDTNGHDYFHNRAYFSVGASGNIVTHTYVEEIGDNEECLRHWDNPSNVFDNTCTFVNFPGLVRAMETLIAKLNKVSEEKDTEIQSFLDFVEGWKNYQKALTEVSEMAKTEETI